MQSRMIARRCAIPYALAHPVRTRLNTEPILPTLPKRIEQSGPPVSFSSRACPLDGFTARAGIPPDFFLAAPIRIPRRPRLASVPWSRTDFEGMLRRRNTGSGMRWTEASATWPESAPGLETCRGSVPSAQSKRGEASPGKDRLRKGVRASATAPTTGAAAPTVATAPRFGLLGGAFLRCVGGSGWLHDYLLPLGSRQVLIASLPWSPRWRE